jgi:arginine-tRNA-protein transferase
MTRAELETLVDLSRIKLNVGGQLYETGDLVMWETASMDDPTSVMGAVADLVAAIGPNLAKNLCITFT